MKKLNFWVERPVYGKVFELHVGFDGEETISLAKPVEFEQIERGLYAGHKPPALELSPTDAQALMDELYRAGVRPTRMESSDGALAATERHLKDMQAIAFGVLATEVELAEQFKKRGKQVSQDNGAHS